MRWKEKNASVVRALNGIEDDFLLSLVFNLLILKLNMRGNSVCTMPPPPKRKNHHQILNMCFSLLAEIHSEYSLVLELNKHKNKKRGKVHSICHIIGSVHPDPGKQTKLLSYFFLDKNILLIVANLKLLHSIKLTMRYSNSTLFNKPATCC